MPHVALLGDSIFDNAAYVRGEPDVVAQVRARLPRGWQATLLAGDGATLSQVPAQVTRLPADMTHLVVSIGGNDALRHVHLLEQRASTVGDVLTWFADVVEPFAAAYTAMLDRLTRTGRQTLVCTVYDGALEPDVVRPARTALALFDDAIQRAARRAAIPVLELRDVCTDAEDHANPIEPPSRGGANIAAAIVAAIVSA